MNGLKRFLKILAVNIFSKIEVWKENQLIKRLSTNSYVRKTVSAKGVILEGDVKIEEHVRLLETYIKGNILIERNAFIKKSELRGNITIGEYAKLLGPIFINGISKITIGKNTTLNGPNFDIHAQLNEVHIGNFCSIARNTSFQEFNHMYKRATSYFIRQNVFNESIEKDIYSIGNIEVGHDVWIGAGCIILSGAKIGSGAIIAANSVVSKEIPPYAIAGGSQAKVIKYRFAQDIIEELLRIEWWHWPHERLKQNRHLFEGELTMDKLKSIY